MENPVACTVTVYWPGARPEIAYWPVASDVPVRLTPAADVTVSEAWGMTAPLGSATWPRSVPRLAVCAKACCKVYPRKKEQSRQAESEESVQEFSSDASSVVRSR